MRAITSLCFFLSCCILSTLSKPMFGTSGMMRRRFPGASEMSYNVYQTISRDNYQPAQVAPTFVESRPVSRFGDDDPMFSSNWMNDFSPEQNSLEEDRRSAPLRRHSKYPMFFNPRKSFAPIHFPQQSPFYIHY